MATDLGKVGIVMKGNWSSSATYEVLDAVSYNGGLYIAKQAVPANTEPTNTTYWQEAISPTSVINQLGQYTDITSDITATNATVEVCKKAQIGAFASLYLVLNVTAANVLITGVPAAPINVVYGLGYNYSKAQSQNFLIGSTGDLTIPVTGSNVGDSIRIAITYPAKL